MASEIRVNKITHTAGVGTITTSADGIVVVGIVTANNFTGSGANLTSLPAGQLTGTVADARLSTVSSSKLSGALPALDGSALTGVGHSFGNSSVNTSGIITATAFVPTTQGSLSHRNIIINGAMMVAQRGTSSTSSGFHTVDRFNVQFGGTDEAMTVEQANVASGTTPYTLGFLKCLKVTNGNQTSGAGGGDWLEIYQYLEDQDICNSGWNFKSATSYLTISFWVKSSVSQKFAGFFYTNTAGQGDSYTYSYQIDNGSGGNLSANTWTKITHTIPGSSSLTFNNDNTKGLAVGIFPFDGTDYTTSGHTEETWQQWSSGNKLKDMDSTWWTTNDATFELTGLQLEVGPVATPFEHLSYANQLRRCQRYYCRITPSNNAFYGVGNIDGGNQSQILVTFPTEMRGRPTSIETTGTPSNYILRVTSNVTCTSVPQLDICTTTNALVVPYANGHGFTDKSGAFLRANGDASFLGFSAEL